MARIISYEEIYSTAGYLAECVTNVFNVVLTFVNRDENLFCILRVSMEFYKDVKIFFEWI
jgi:hypothetical protein